MYNNVAITDQNNEDRFTSFQNNTYFRSILSKLKLIQIRIVLRKKFLKKNSERRIFSQKIFSSRTTLIQIFKFISITVFFNEHQKKKRSNSQGCHKSSCLRPLITISFSFDDQKLNLYQVTFYIFWLLYKVIRNCCCYSFFVKLIITAMWFQDYYTTLYIVSYIKIKVTSKFFEVYYFII